MASFDIEVDGTKYEMAFTRDSVRKFERAGGSFAMIKDMQCQTVTDSLFVIGIMTNNPLINSNLAGKILEKALDEYGTMELFGMLVEPFMEVFMSGGHATKKSVETPKAD